MTAGNGASQSISEHIKPTPTAPMHPLCVDLDGTLVASDTLWENLLRVLKAQPWMALMLPLWLITRGKAGLKEQLAKRIDLARLELPYRPEVVNFVRASRNAGQKTILVTAANYRIANAVAQKIDLFDEVIASSSTENRKGRSKQNLLVERFGEHGFDYIGNSRDDIPVWQSADKIYTAGACATTLVPKEKVTAQLDVSDRSFSLRSLVKAIRLTQWIKNVLLFVPLFTSHSYTMTHVTNCLIGFLVFSLTASSVYLVNDLLDLDADRLHHKKCKRPFAAGTLAIPYGIFLSVLLLTGSFILSLSFLSLRFTGMLAIYWIATSLYSFTLKRRLLVDVMLLAALYSHRIISGGVAIQVEITPWLLAFSMFLFLSLAFVKRYSELRRLENSTVGQAAGRAYLIEDLKILGAVGPAGGYMAVLVFALYINGETARLLYHRPEMLWAICPLLLYWITRIWILAGRGTITEDPVLFAITDKISLLTGLLMAVCAVLATF